MQIHKYTKISDIKCCWCVDAAEALMLLVCWCCWCTDAADVADSLMLLMYWCCWCADAAVATDAFIAADILMLLMRWCCWCVDAADALMHPLPQAHFNMPNSNRYNISQNIHKYWYINRTELATTNPGNFVKCTVRSNLHKSSGWAGWPVMSSLFSMSWGQILPTVHIRLSACKQFRFW